MPYKEQIKTKNEDFFNKNDFDKDMEGKQNLMDIFKEIKSIWIKSNNKDKNKIFEYFIVLCNIVDEYIRKT